MLRKVPVTASKNTIRPRLGSFRGELPGTLVWNWTMISQRNILARRMLRKPKTRAAWSIRAEHVLKYSAWSTWTHMLHWASAGHATPCQCPRHSYGNSRMRKLASLIINFILCVVRLVGSISINGANIVSSHYLWFCKKERGKMYNLPINIRFAQFTKLDVFERVSLEKVNGKWMYS